MILAEDAQMMGDVIESMSQFVLTAAPPLVVVGLTVWGFWRMFRSTPRTFRLGPPRGEEPPRGGESEPPREGEMRRRWDGAVRRYAALLEDVCAADTDPATVFDRPLIVDVTEEATAAFYEAWDRALGRHREQFPGDADAVTGFEQAVRTARRAWDAADANARAKAGRGIGSQGRVYTSGEIADLTTARKLMTLALDPASPAAEAASAYRRMRDLLDPILGAVPAPLDEALAGILSAPQRRSALAPAD